jgi:hypothetical protein
MKESLGNFGRSSDLLPFPEQTTRFSIKKKQKKNTLLLMKWRNKRECLSRVSLTREY